MFSTQTRSDVIGQLVQGVQTGDPVTIVYVDKDNVTSIRDITIKGIERAANGSTIVRAFCLNRQAPRTFCLNGVTQAERNNVATFISVVHGGR